jgi:elongation factor 1-gamma
MAPLGILYEPAGNHARTRKVRFQTTIFSSSPFAFLAKPLPTPPFTQIPFSSPYASQPLTPAACLAQIHAAAKIGGLELTAPDTFTYDDAKSDSYRAKFPLGKVPGFETTSGFFLSESLAIAEYVARKGSAAAQLLGAADEEAALVRQWLCFTTEHVGPSLLPLCMWRIGYGKYDADKNATAAVELERWLGYIEGHLGRVEGKGEQWLVKTAAGKGPSLADLGVAEVMYFALAHYVDQEMREKYPKIVAWYERVRGYEGMEQWYAVDMVEKRKEPPTEG